MFSARTFSRAHIALELSELQLPTLSRGTDIAVYTHVTPELVPGLVRRHLKPKSLLTRARWLAAGLAENGKVPIRFIGVGESAKDLRPFDAGSFVNAILPID